MTNKEFINDILIILDKYQENKEPTIINDNDIDEIASMLESAINNILILYYRPDN